jgi:ankyrin repeat protein
MKAARCGRTKTVKLLLAHGADVNATAKNGWTALMCAAREGHIETMKLLLAHGADVNAADKDGRTAWMQACRENHTEAAEFLLENGAHRCNHDFEITEDCGNRDNHANQP